MNRKDTLAAIRALGMAASYDPDAREYRVAPGLGRPLAGGRGEQARQRAAQEAAAYYTADRDDALATARRMPRTLEA